MLKHCVFVVIKARAKCSWKTEGKQEKSLESFRVAKSGKERKFLFERKKEEEEKKSEFSRSKVVRKDKIENLHPVVVVNDKKRWEVVELFNWKKKKKKLFCCDAALTVNANCWFVAISRAPLHWFLSHARAHWWFIISNSSFMGSSNDVTKLNFPRFQRNNNKIRFAFFTFAIVKMYFWKKVERNGKSNQISNG